MSAYPELPLSLDELLTLLRKLGVNEEGISLVQKIRHGEPVRTVHGGGRSVVGRYPSLKMGRTIQYESRTVEFPFVMLCEVDEAVDEYYDQSFRLPLDYWHSPRRRIVTSTTPDFFVISRRFVGFVECKPEDHLVQLAERSPARYQLDAEGLCRCPPGEEAAARYGLGYRVWTPQHVSPAFVENTRFLLAEWGRSERAFADADVARVVDRVQERVGLTLDELVHSVGDPDVVHYCLFRSLVHVDLSAALLSESDRIRVFTHAEAARVWHAAVDSVGVDESSRLSPEDVIRSRLAEYSPEALRVALERYASILPVIRSDAPASSIVGSGASTRRRWLIAFRKAQHEYGLGIIGLCPNHHLKGNRTPRLLQEVQVLMDAVAEEEYETAVNMTVTAAYIILRHRIEDANSQRSDKAKLPCPSYQTFGLYLKSRDLGRTTKRRQGAKRAASDAPCTTSAGDSMLMGQGPLDVVHIDHTQLDLGVRYGLIADSRVDRPWLTIAVCAWSRRVVGYDLSFDAPSIYGLFTTMRDLYHRQWRMPNRVLVDRGSEFNSIAFEQLCAACMIDKRSRPPGMPRFGATIERLFGTINVYFVHALEGNTQLLKNPRQLTPAVDPAKHAVWSFERLDTRIRELLFNTYPALPHSGLDGQTPEERYEVGRKTVGAGRAQANTPELQFLLHPPAPRIKAKVHVKHGIVIDHVRYWHPRMLHDRVRGAKVPVRVDPHDIGRVFAFLAGRWEQCLAAQYTLFSGYSRKELRFASAMARHRFRGKWKRSQERINRLAEMLRALREDEAAQKQALRDRSHRDALDRRGLRLVTDAERPSCSADSARDWAAPRRSLDLADIPRGKPL